MPRIATKLTPDVLHARMRLKEYLAQPDHTQTSLSRESGIPQYTISKFLKGRIRSLTPPVQVFLTYVNIGIKSDSIRLTEDPRIKHALDAAWDGSDAGISVIASTLYALAPVLRSSSMQTRTDGTDTRG